jgi:hypothetical protein
MSANKLSKSTTCSSWTHDRARVAALSRSRTPDDPDLLDARRNLRAARAEDYIRALVDGAPPLTDEQKHRLSVLLNTSAAVVA